MRHAESPQSTLGVSWCYSIDRNIDHRISSTMWVEAISFFSSVKVAWDSPPHFKV